MIFPARLTLHDHRVGMDLDSGLIATRLPGGGRRDVPNGATSQPPAAS